VHKPDVLFRTLVPFADRFALPRTDPFALRTPKYFREIIIMKTTARTIASLLSLIAITSALLLAAAPRLALGDVYVASLDDGTVQRFNDLTGVPMPPNTIPGSVFAAQTIQQADGIAFGPDKNMYISSRAFTPDGVNFSAGAVYQYNPTTQNLGVFAQGGASVNGHTPISAPAGLKFDGSGNLYVADNGNAAVHVFASNGSQSPDVPLTGLGAPGGILFGPNGDLFISDFANGNVIEKNLTSGVQTNLVAAHAGGLQTPGPLLFIPSGPGLSTFDLLVTDLFGNQILRFNPDGTFKSQFASITPAPVPNGTTIQFPSNFPSDLIFDRSGSQILVDVSGPDHGNKSGVIRVYDVNGNYLSNLITGLNGPTALTLSAVPEPGTLLLAAIGGLGLLWVARRRSR